MGAINPNGLATHQARGDQLGPRRERLVLGLRFQHSGGNVAVKLQSISEGENFHMSNPERTGQFESLEPDVRRARDSQLVNHFVGCQSMSSTGFMELTA